MRLGDFTDVNFIIFLVVIIVLGVSLAVIIFLYVLRVYSDDKFKLQVDYESTTTRIYIVDVKNNKIVQLNKSDLANKVTYDLFSFYTSFHPNDSDRVKDWIYRICVDYKNADEYLEADISLDSNKRFSFALLRLLSYNANSGLIHLESHILKYITPNYLSNKKKVDHRRIPTGIVKRSQISNIINRNKSLSGYTFCIRFFYTRQKVISNDKIERYMVMNLKNSIYPFASGPKLSRQIMDNGESEVFIYDIHISSRETALQLAQSMAKTLKRQMEVNGFTGYINFAIGIIENGQFYQDYDTIEEKAREACISGQTNSQQIVFYQRNIKANNDMVKYTEQIDHLLEEGVLRYLYRPIINVKTSQIIGYFEYVKAYDSPFSSFSEMSKYATRINKNLDLFALIAKHVISKFVNERQSPSMDLFLSVSMVDINSVTEIISQIPYHDKANIVLVFDEQEVNENSNNTELLIGTLNSLRSNGFELALSLKDKNLLLDEKIYFLFHYFVVGSAMMEEVKHNNRIRLSLYTLIESLLKYNRPIIATDLEGWQAVELIIKSGINYISSDAVAPTNDMLLPVEKKKMEKVVQMADKYL